jgi:hypothetical protein
MVGNGCYGDISWFDLVTMLKGSIKIKVSVKGIKFESERGHSLYKIFTG